MHWKSWLKRKSSKMTLGIMAGLNKLTTHEMVVKFFKIKGINPPSRDECVKEGIIPACDDALKIPDDLQSHNEPLAEASVKKIEESHVEQHAHQKEDAPSIKKKESPPSRKKRKTSRKTKKDEK